MAHRYLSFLHLSSYFIYIIVCHRLSRTILLCLAICTKVVYLVPMKLLAYAHDSDLFETIKSYLYENSIPIPEAGCWIWEKAHNNQNYGLTWVQDKLWLAHRLSFLVFNGHIPDNVYICHKCDTSLCINPHHLYI